MHYVEIVNVLWYFFDFRELNVSIVPLFTHTRSQPWLVYDRWWCVNHCSTYNFAGKLYNRLLSAYANKDTEAAKLEQRRSQAMLRIYFNYGKHLWHLAALCFDVDLVFHWRASEAGETLSGLFNRESRIYIYYIYIVCANFVLITRKEGGA